MNTVRLTKLREADDRLIGVSLSMIGLGWISLQPLATELTGALGLYPSEVVSGSIGIGTIHIVFGLVLLSNEQLNRSFSFSESVLAGVVALVASSGVLLYWEVIQSGVVRVEALASFSSFACYVAAWGFPLGFASTRRQRFYAIGGLCVIPVAMLVAIPVLVLINGGWLILIAAFSIPVVLALIPLILLLAAPLLIAGWSARSLHSATTK
ncbi:hypothetical protein [Natronorubrum sp. FCH18a]|uniref:hypothetical protein n=1 Tax=Natronorubrum sp. FCH18a TaxID=3447018 RepID=UPI003F510052